MWISSLIYQKESAALPTTFRAWIGNEIKHNRYFSNGLIKFVSAQYRRLSRLANHFDIQVAQTTEI